MDPLNNLTPTQLGKAIMESDAGNTAMAFGPAGIVSKARAFGLTAKSAIEKMSAGKINSRLDALDQQSSKLMDDFIAAGRATEKPSEYLKKNDPLAERAKKIFSEQNELRDEIARRYGPGAPHRLPIKR